VEFSSSSEFLRLVAARARSPPPPPERRGRSRKRDPPLLSFLLLEHLYQGCPFRHGLASRLVRGGRGLPSPRRCRPQGWFPLDGSGCERGGADPEEPVLFHVRPWALRPCFMPLAFPGAFPFRAFPSRGAVPALAGLSLLPCGFAFDDRRRGPGEPFAPLSPPCRPFATVYPRVHRTHGPGRWFPALLDRPSCVPEHVDRDRSLARTELAGKPPSQFNRISHLELGLRLTSGLRRMLRPRVLLSTDLQLSSVC